MVDLGKWRFSSCFCIWNILGLGIRSGVFKAHASIHARRKRKVAPVAPTLIALLAIQFIALSTAPIVSGTSPTYHILLAGDEEFIWGGVWGVHPPFWFPHIWDGEEATTTVAERFQSQVGFNLVFHWWAEWDSDDNVHEAWDVLTEAITELHWYVGYEFEGQKMDMLVAITDQDYVVNPSKGLAFPWSQAVLVNYYSGAEDTGNVMQHELGHVFALDHCGWWDCVMNADVFPILGLTHGFCETCAALCAQDKRGLLVGSNDYSQGTTNLGKYYFEYYKHSLGTVVTISATAKSDYKFSNWQTLEGRFVSSTNPITITMDSGKSFVAHFEIDYPPGGGGGAGKGKRGSRLKLRP